MNLSRIVLSATRILIIYLAALVAACSSLPDRLATPNQFPPPSHAELESSKLHQQVKQASAKHSGKSGFYALESGVDALAARLALIDQAEVSLDLQYYIWHDDLSGRLLFNSLLNAADRGVKVRLLLDDIDTPGKDRLLSLLQANQNIDIRLFNPFINRNVRWWNFLTDSTRLDHRMHNKSLTADRIVSIIGGRNIGDEYFETGDRIGFSDLDVLVSGSAAKEVNASFDEFWSSQWAYPLGQIATDIEVTDEDYANYRQTLEIYLHKSLESELRNSIELSQSKIEDDLGGKGVVWSGWQFWHDKPSTVEHTHPDRDSYLAPKIIELLQSAQREILIVSPYFVPGDKLTDLLVNKAQQGLTVKVLTNSLASNDVPIVYAGYINYREELIKGGVEVYELMPTSKRDKSKGGGEWSGSSSSSLHGKYLGIDANYFFVGSFNLDPRSAFLNTELGIVFETPSYYKLLSDGFNELTDGWGYRVYLDDNGDETWETLVNGERVTFDSAPEVSSWDNFWVNFLSIIVPESEL
ncbi:phospholipase D family protein [Gilvimarinus chinensis]|uniref:phospholipase D family protein n=1 Tax=Gilvimarinus chinensis TaxID=396005 RepID=UPI000373A33A|nr:phospholipase D family protein [Gilvimarinus chinensis]